MQASGPLGGSGFCVTHQASPPLSPVLSGVWEASGQGIQESPVPRSSRCVSSAQPMATEDAGLGSEVETRLRQKSGQARAKAQHLVRAVGRGASEGRGGDRPQVSLYTRGQPVAGRLEAASESLMQNGAGHGPAVADHPEKQSQLEPPSLPSVSPPPTWRLQAVF